MTTKTFTRFNAPSGYSRHDSSATQRCAAFGEVIPLVCMRLVWPFPRSTRLSADARKRVDHRLKEHGVMSICTAEQHHKRDALVIHRDVSFSSAFAFVRRICPCFRAPRGAGTVPESTEKRSQSKASAAFSSLKSSLWSRSQTPACCHSRSRLQQVMPLPQPISRGNFSQGVPVSRMKRIPRSASLSLTRGLPPFGFGRCGGSSGFTSVHRRSNLADFIATSRRKSRENLTS